MSDSSDEEIPDLVEANTAQVPVTIITGKKYSSLFDNRSFLSCTERQ